MVRTMRQCWLLWTLVFSIAGTIPFCSRAEAQVSAGRISGVVSDPSGAAVPNAKIAITNSQTGITREFATNGTGLYNVPNLPAGTYNLKVTASGFESVVRNGVVLNVGGAPVLNFTLRLGSVNQEVDVSGAAPAVDLTESTMSGVVNGRSVRELPLNGRSWTDLADLTPGVTAINTQAPITSGDRPKRGLGGELSISGGRPQQNNYMLDGININDYSNAGPGSVLGGNLGVDAVAEFSVVTVNPGAQYGRTSAGVVSAITRSGANQFHGSAYEFLRNSSLDSRNYFDVIKPEFRRNQFGASFGGPIQRDKTFFFADYEGVRQTLGISTISIVPSAAARAGNLSTGKVTPDPSVARFINAFYPLPNGQNFGDTGEFIFASPQITSENYFITRLDHTFSARDSLAGTYMFDNSPSSQPDELNNKVILSKTRRQMVSLLENHTFSSATLNAVHFGFSRDNAGSPYTATAINAAANDPTFGFVPGDSAGAVQVPGLVTFSGGLSAANPLLFRWNSWQLYDDVSHTIGIHSLSFGANIERIEDNQFSADTPGGFYQFNSLPDFITNVPATLLATLPGTITPRYLRQTIFGTYFQDDMRLRPNLTVNLGMRYEIASVPDEIHGRLSNLRVLRGSTPHTGNPYILNPTFHNFEPRVGFAWDPLKNGKTSVRGGFGIFDILPYIVEMGSGVDASFPFAQNVTGANLTPGSFPLQAFFEIANNPSDHRVYVLQYHPPRNYVMQWNLNVQRQLSQNTALTLGYVGSRGIHLWYQTDDGNIVMPVAHNSAGYFWPTPVGSGTVIDPLVGRVLVASWSADSYYDGVQVQFNRRMSHGLQGEASYSFSRCIDTSSGSAASDQYRNSLAATLWIDPRTHRGLCDTNVSHDLVLNSIWNVPQPHGLSSPLEWAGSGWEFSGIFTASSGQPFSVMIAGDPLGLNSVVPFDFPDRLMGPGCASPVNPGNPNDYIKLQCFAFPNPSNRMGNAGRNSLIGPGIVNLDFSIYKNNPLKFISEQANLQFRADFFNLLNHADFFPPTDNNTLFDQSGNLVQGAGLIDQTTLTAREIQFALKFVF